MTIRLGRWEITGIKKVLYWCSECGNVDNPQKDKCCICNAKMINCKEIADESEAEIPNRGTEEGEM